MKTQENQGIMDSMEFQRTWSGPEGHQESLP